jgi:hypothetical protein
MYSNREMNLALAALRGGEGLAAVSRRFGMQRSTLRAWRDAPQPRAVDCPRCECRAIDEEAYAALFGYYLGDGCVSQRARRCALRISCDAKYPLIVTDVERALERVRPGSRTFEVHAPGVIVVQSNWKHWPCLLPQHGSGRKHERALTMQNWQWTIVEKHPAQFLRGLFHSDGCRVRNWATQVVAGRKKRYEYPRWQFTNESADIMRWCRDALDLAGIPFRQSSRRCLSVSRRDAVNRLDELIGLKA